MLVHFPIALLFTAFLLDAVAVWRGDRFWARAGMVVLWLALISSALAIAAGLYAASHVLVNPSVKPLLRAHRRDGILTGLAVMLVVGLRLRVGSRGANGGSGPDSLPLRLRQWAYPLGGYVLALIMISITGDLGGSMVYGHGLGVAATPPAVVSGARPTRTPATATSNAAQIATGRHIYVSTCTTCHGPTPPFTHALVQSMGSGAMAQFITSRMPPGNPVSPAQAKALVSYFNSL
jgi:uncharacterized membrane protein